MPSIKSKDLDEVLERACEAVADNIRTNHFRRLATRRSIEKLPDEIDIREMLKQDAEDDDDEE